MNSFQNELAERVYTNPKFQEDFDNLLSYNFARLNNNFDRNSNRISIKRLAESALIMASSNIDNHKKTAFEIATLLYESSSNAFPGINGFMKLICTRSGNIPAINLIDKEKAILPASLDVESQFEINKNTISINNNQLTLSDFQANSIYFLRHNFSVSLSAPTSAGKSFLITHYIVSKFAEHKEYCVAVIVPTRALIRQFVTDFTSVFSDYSKNNNEYTSDSVELVTSSLENERQFESKKLFILTQERLQAVLYNWKNIPNFNLLIVDESQKIADSKRGIILEDTLSELNSIQRDTQYIFLSPLSANPEFLFNIINFQKKYKPIFSSISPVAQHVYAVTFRKTGKKEKNRVDISKIGNSQGRVIFSTSIEGKSPTSIAKRVAFVAKLLGNNSSNILYANGPSDAEKMALFLTENEDQEVVNPVEVKETIEFLSNNIHEEYHLNECLRNGVGYHYGSMPDIARIAVEDLFRNEHISYIACTSTLLEGINLPAKNVFIENPKLGQEPMDDSSFWNLAGRAGRLMKDLSGNVYCINQDGWERPASERKKEYSIESSFSSTLNKEAFISYCRRISPEIDMESYEQAINSLIIRTKEKGEENTKTFLESRVEETKRQELFNVAASLTQSIQIPKDILKKNKSIDARLQQSFMTYLTNLSDEQISKIIPLQPYGPDFYEVLEEIFRLCDTHLMIKKRGNRYRYFTMIANKWIRERSLKDIIKDSIEYNHQQQKSKDVNTIIRELITSLNNEVRYHYVKYTKCFCDLLQNELNRRDRSSEDFPYSDFNLPNYLELGMSQKGTIYLHNVGLSRTTAIEVNRFCSQRGVKSEEIVAWVRERSQEIAHQLPRPLRVEIQKFFR